MQPNTTYEWKVRSICGTVVQSPSAYTSLIQFTTNNSARMQGEDLHTRNEGLFKAYPNPANQKVNIDLPKNFKLHQTKITIYSQTGKLVQTHEPGNEHVVQLDVQKLQNGLYQLVVSDGNTVRNEKLIILH